MKPCASRRETVALLAGGVCPDGQAAELRQHLRVCSGCRESFERLSEICQAHVAAADRLPEAQVSARLSSRVASRIRAGAEPRQTGAWAVAFAGWGRIAGLAALLALVVLGAIRLREPIKPPPAVRVTQVPTPTPAPTLAGPGGGASAGGGSLVAYRLALNRSPEALEELLSEEAARPTLNPQIALRVGPDLPEFEL